MGMVSRRTTGCMLLSTDFQRPARLAFACALKFATAARSRPAQVHARHPDRAEGTVFRPGGSTVLKANDSLLLFTDQASSFRLRAIVEARCHSGEKEVSAVALSTAQEGVTAS